MKTILRPTRNVTRLVSIMALLGLLLTALPVFAGGQTETATGEVSKINLALGDIETVETLHLLIALEKVKERGIDVEMVSFKSEDVAAQAVVNGQSDIGIGTPYALIQNVNAPIRIFFRSAPCCSFRWSTPSTTTAGRTWTAKRSWCTPARPGRWGLRT